MIPTVIKLDYNTQVFKKINYLKYIAQITLTGTCIAVNEMACNAQIIAI
jgi:hypothetical protein